MSLAAGTRNKEHGTRLGRTPQVETCGIARFVRNLGAFVDETGGPLTLALSLQGEGIIEGRGGRA